MQNSCHPNTYPHWNHHCIKFSWLCKRIDLKLMPFILLDCPTTEEISVTDTAVKTESSWQLAIIIFVLLQIADGWQFGKMVSDMKAEVYHSSLICRKKFFLANIHWYFLNVYEDQTVGVSTIRWWILFQRWRHWHERQALSNMTINQWNEEHINQLNYINQANERWTTWLTFSCQCYKYSVRLRCVEISKK